MGLPGKVSCDWLPWVPALPSCRGLSEGSGAWYQSGGEAPCARGLPSLYTITEARGLLTQARGSYLSGVSGEAAGLVYGRRLSRRSSPRRIAPLSALRPTPRPGH